MEVPCCSGLPHMVEKAMALANADIPMQQIVVSTRGKIIEERKVA
jgi:hypothetical protein